MAQSLIHNSFFDPSALRINDSTPVKVTFLHAAPETEHHLVGFYTFDNSNFRDIRILFSNAHNGALIPNVSSVFLGNRLNGKTPVFFIIENGFALNSSSSWFADASSGKNGFWKFLAPPEKDGLLPALERGSIVWKDEQNNTVEQAREARLGTVHPLLVWQSNNGLVSLLNGTIYHSYGYGLYPKLNPDKEKHALLILEEETSSVVLNFAGQTVENLESAPLLSLRLQIGERNFSALTKNRIGCFIPLNLSKETTVTEMTVQIPPESGNTLYLDGFEEQTTLPLARRTFTITSQGTQITLAAEAPSAIYEALCSQIKIKTNAAEQAECPVRIILQTNRGEIVRTGTVEILSENILSGTIFSSLSRLPGVQEPVKNIKPYKPMAAVYEKNNDPLPSFLTTPAEEKAPPTLAKTAASLLTKAPPKNKTVLVTGAARRIGRAIALLLARRGWNILVHANNSLSEASRLVEEIQQNFGVKAAYIRADLSDIAETADLIPSASGTYGTIDALVNNASVFEQDDVFSCTPETWAKNMTVNLHAPFLLSQAFAAQLPKGTEGNIINILDQRVLNLTPYFTSYTLSKASLAALTKTMALALAPFIRVNAVAPGDVLPALKQSKSDFERRSAEAPLGHGVSPEEVAAAVSFILDIPGLTGHILPLDSGQHMNWSPERKG